MPNDQQISDRFSAVESLISDAKKWSKNEGQLNAHLATYVCVMLSGEIEAAIERMIILRMHTLNDNETAMTTRQRITLLKLWDKDLGIQNGR